jgi:hypothetical protein
MRTTLIIGLQILAVSAAGPGQIDSVSEPTVKRWRCNMVWLGSWIWRRHPSRRHANDGRCLHGSMVLAGHWEAETATYNSGHIPTLLHLEPRNQVPGASSEIRGDRCNDFGATNGDRFGLGEHAIQLHGGPEQRTCAQTPNPDGDPLLGYFAVNPWTGDICDEIGCEQITSPASGRSWRPRRGQPFMKYPRVPQSS